MGIRRQLEATLAGRASRWPVLTVTGPRQSGKTTLCRATFPHKQWISLELPDIRDRAERDPRGLLRSLPDGAILDEVQRAPGLLSYLQVDVDERPEPGRWILTGSHNLLLMQSVSQTLAGRAALLSLLPLSMRELSDAHLLAPDWQTAAFLGGWPAPLVRNIPIDEWLASYIASYVERDVREVLRVVDLAQFQRFLRLCAGRAGQVLNVTALGADAGITHNTAEAWLAALEASYIAFRLQPWHGNLAAREVKAPKLLFWDTALCCNLLGIRSAQELDLHPLRGGLFENLIAVELQKASLNAGRRPGWFFWRDHRGDEVDLAEPDALGNATAIECKSGETWANDWSAGLKRLAGRLRDRGKNLRAAVVYGGTEERMASPETGGVGLVPWTRAADWLREGARR